MSIDPSTVISALFPVLSSPLTVMMPVILTTASFSKIKSPWIITVPLIFRIAEFDKSSVPQTSRLPSMLIVELLPPDRLREKETEPIVREPPALIVRELLLFIAKFEII